MAKPHPVTKQENLHLSCIRLMTREMKRLLIQNPMEMVDSFHLIHLEILQRLELIGIR